MCLDAGMLHRLGDQARAVLRRLFFKEPNRDIRLVRVKARQVPRRERPDILAVVRRDGVRDLIVKGGGRLISGIADVVVYICRNMVVVGDSVIAAPVGSLAGCLQQSAAAVFHEPIGHVDSPELLQRFGIPQLLRREDGAEGHLPVGGLAFLLRDLEGDDIRRFVQLALPGDVGLAAAVGAEAVDRLVGGDHFAAAGRTDENRRLVDRAFLPDAGLFVSGGVKSAVAVIAFKHLRRNIKMKTAPAAWAWVHKSLLSLIVFLMTQLPKEAFMCLRTPLPRLSFYLSII